MGKGIETFCRIIGWLHHIVFSLLVFITCCAVIYGFYNVFQNQTQIQNIVLVLVAGFAATTIFGIFIHASYEFIKGLQKRDHSRMIMFRICSFVLIAVAVGVISCGIYRVNAGYDFTEKISLQFLISGTTTLIFEIIVTISAGMMFRELKFEAKQLRIERYRRRKKAAVSQQMSNILQPFEMDKVDMIEEKSFEKTHVEKKRFVFEEISPREDVGEDEEEKLPPPPEGF